MKSHSEFLFGFLSQIEKCQKVEIIFFSKQDEKMKLTILKNQIPYFNDIAKLAKEYAKRTF